MIATLPPLHEFPYVADVLDRVQRLALRDDRVAGNAEVEQEAPHRFRLGGRRATLLLDERSTAHDDPGRSACLEHASSLPDAVGSVVQFGLHRKGWGGGRDASAQYDDGVVTAGRVAGHELAGLLLELPVEQPRHRRKGQDEDLEGRKTQQDGG
jgi:hypothetical protein